MLCRFLIAIWGLFLLPLFSFALDVPDEFQKVLVEKGQGHLIKKFENVPTANPNDFVNAVDLNHTKFAGAGFNGVTFRNKRLSLVKFSHLVLLEGETRERWKALLAYPSVSGLTLDVHKLVTVAHLLKSKAGEKELLGTLLWSAYDVRAEQLLPDLVSDDGLAYRRTFLEGVPFDQVLKGASEQKFDMKKLWQRVTEAQRLGEKMLLEMGVMVDFLNPANFIVSGTYDNPQIDLTDLELIAPSKETIDYYAEQGHIIPKSEYSSTRHMVVWPLMPDHIVLNKNWGLSFEQAVEFLQIRYQLESQAEAIAKLASIPEWPIAMFPAAANYSSIHRARDLIHCQSVFLPDPDSSGVKK